MPHGWDGAAEELYADFLGDLAGQFSSIAAVETILAGHQARLRSLLALREGESLSDIEPIWATYAPDLQLRLLGLDPLRTPGPVLDLGCGEDGALVRHMEALGRSDVFGIDVLCETGGGLSRASWFDAPLAPGRWGTIIAHQSFTLHFLRAHALGSESGAARHARTYMRMLGALGPQGRFLYAPAVPFFEMCLPKDTWNVHRRNLPIPHVERRPFQRTCVSRRVQT